MPQSNKDRGTNHVTNTTIKRPHHRKNQNDTTPDAADSDRAQPIFHAPNMPHES